MNDYLRRAGKFIIYMVLIFVLVLVVFPLISKGTAPNISFNDFLHNQRFMLFFGLLLIYAFIYPSIAYVKLKRHLNGPFSENRAVFEKAFSTLQFTKTEETTEKIIYRRKSNFARFVQWYEDSIVIDITENPVVLSGNRKAVTRIDRIVDQLLIRASE